MSKPTREHYLNAMGITSWRLRPGVDIKQGGTGRETSQRYTATVKARAKPVSTRPVALAIMPEEVLQEVKKQDDIIESVAKTRYDPGSRGKLKSDEILTQAEVKIEAVPSPETGSKTFDNEAWQMLEDEITQCRQCHRRNNRLSSVSGNGQKPAEILVITEPPLAEEERAGRYIGEKAEKLFSYIQAGCLSSQGYSRSPASTYITGCLKCRALDALDVGKEEMDNCFRFLHRQVKLLQPRVIVVFSIAAAKYLLEEQASFETLRGRIHTTSRFEYPLPVVISYSPAFLLRHPLFKKKSFDDWMLVRSLLRND